MDAILEVIKKSILPIERGNASSEGCLDNIYKDYIKDIETALEVSKNPLCGESLCEKLYDAKAIIKCLCNEILEIYELNNCGLSVKAGQKAFEIFNKIKPFLMITYTRNGIENTYFRIREYDYNNPFLLERRELFHIPISKRERISASRYSMAGYPCLYLSNSAQICWFECGMPTVFAIAKFDLPQSKDDNLRLVDFSPKPVSHAHQLHCWRMNEKTAIGTEQLENYIIKYLVTYPLRAACSIVTSYNSEISFTEEYVIPQLLLQWVHFDDDFSGIKYESASKYECVRPYGGSNVVLVSKKFDKDGYDITLRKTIRVSTPQLFDLPNIDVNNIFSWGMDSINADYEFI